MDLRKESALSRSSQAPRINLKTLDPPGLESLALRLGEPAYRGRQLLQWLHGKGVRSFGAMTNLPAAFRAKLQAHCTIDSITLATVRTSDDGTTKALFSLLSRRLVEAVLIPDPAAGRFTACVSSQVGCAMDCAFCATGRMGFSQNLTPGEIYDQAYYLNTLAHERFGHGLTNVVYMGMGEPLLNYDSVRTSLTLLTHPQAMGLAPRRITVSTVGLARRIRMFADEDLGVNLAVSLHAPTEEKRSRILPVNRSHATGLNTLLESLQYYCRTTRRRITFEYCLFLDFNDTEEDARALVRICRQLRSKVNLIMYNAVAGLRFMRTTEERLNRFMRILASHKVPVTVRRSRGEDIEAACGQLATTRQAR